MADPDNQYSFLDEIDSRQNEVLAQLDELNNQIEHVLNDWLTARTTDSADG
jgi:hypothetical protein